MSLGDRLGWIVATGAGTGAIPRAPGTVASLAAVLAVLALDRAWALPWWGTGGLAAGAAVANLLLGGWIRRRESAAGAHDPQYVVIDEWAGQLLALTFPGRGAMPWLGDYLLAFLLFRFFDVTKILGARRAEKLPGAAGILCDDLVAGAYALGAMVGIRYAM